MSIWPSVVAVLGTLAGALTAGLLQHRSARTARAEQRADSHRQDQLGAVTDFAAALDAHRSAMFHQERLALTEARTEHQLEAQSRSHDTRAAITAPHIRLQVLVPELAGPAQQAADATYALRKATGRTEPDDRRRAAKEASGAFVAAAATLLSPNNRCLRATLPASWPSGRAGPILTALVRSRGGRSLLCIDELGYMDLDRHGAELLVQVLTEHEEKNGVAIASNESIGGWDLARPVLAGLLRGLCHVARPRPAVVLTSGCQ
ncbi:ATP-binding protein [Streptomyces sp. N2A]|uniref:ATP-binding protein n=1 Tax=Streptomyces sp. N2A TaxID=3073936 RepID=UPI00286FB461|nr:ATP-binding protein [Streptomyces sp. N2A]